MRSAEGVAWDLGLEILPGSRWARTRGVYVDLGCNEVRLTLEAVGRHKTSARAVIRRRRSERLGLPEAGLSDLATVVLAAARKGAACARGEGWVE